jgi:hypothetical protein
MLCLLIIQEDNLSENKTRPTDSSVTTFLETVLDPALQEDCQSIIRLMEEVSGLPPVLWGNSIIGFGIYHYKYESGREGDMPVIAFSPRKQAITIYLKVSLKVNLKVLSDELKKLGKHKTGVGCLYIQSLKVIDQTVFKQLLAKIWLG